jgi:RNA polymerase sigma-70 factor (ECF subfamily)
VDSVFVRARYPRAVVPPAASPAPAAPALREHARATPEELAEEGRLVDLARAGDDDAFAQLVRIGAPAAIGAARRITRDAALAEDAAQEAFIRAHRALRDYRHESSFSAWIRKIAIRTAIDLVRRRRPEDPIAESLLSGASEEKQHEDADLLREALAALSPLDREILFAREVEGVGDREVARRFEMTVTGVRVRMHRARRRLQARFKERR